eukprot:RCo005586
MSGWVQRSEEVLGKVPQEYHAHPSAFVITKVVARCLRDPNARQEVDALEELEGELDSLCSEFVESSFGGFNHSISTFSKVLQSLGSSRALVTSLRKDVQQMIATLVFHGSTVAELDARLKTYSHLLRALDDVQEVVELDPRVGAWLEQKDYVSAVQALEKCE